MTPSIPNIAVADNLTGKPGAAAAIACPDLDAPHKPRITVQLSHRHGDTACPARCTDFAFLI